uniref:Putative cytotoxin-like protein n=1 Tax=Ixodes ricinus TaxID=34613 RepID=A0A6B0UMQ7_IXORI
MAQSFPLHLLLLFLVTIEQSSCNLFDLEDAVYLFLVTSCANDERVATYDITGDNLTRGLKAGETMDKHPPVTIKVGPVKYGSAQVQSLQLSAVSCHGSQKSTWREPLQHCLKHMTRP